MYLIVEREPSEGGATLGKLYVDGHLLCDTLEDEVRELPGVPVAQWKQYGKTAIPQGIYRVTLEDSPRFGPYTMTVNGVNGFDKIRIHAGNDAEDTHGCLLVGTRNSDSTIGQSRLALSALKQRVLNAALAGDEVLIEYKNAAAVV
jgi:hypothetical protein